MTIVLKYLNEFGHTTEFLVNDTEIQLRKRRIIEIDLTPLSKHLPSQYMYLTLELDGNLLTEIDLSPLHACTHLEILGLSSNQLTEIDLSPLSSSTRLRYLDLSSNNLEEVDLSGIKFAGEKYFERSPALWLGNNKLKTIELASNSLGYLSLEGNELEEFDLRRVPEVEEIHLERNQLSSIDLSSLVFTSEIYLDDNQLENIDFSRICNQGLETLKTISLKNNRLTQLDLAPFQDCYELTKIDVTGNKIPVIDISQTPNVKIKAGPDTKIIL